MIDTSGKWWKGKSFEDLAEFMKLFWKQETKSELKRVLQSKCKCGNTWFILLYEEDEQIAKRICPKCKRETFICDSGEYWNEAIKDSKPKKLRCIECKDYEHEIGVGFQYNVEDGGINWILVGSRCKKCHILGALLDIKIDYVPLKNLEKQI